MESAEFQKTMGKIEFEIMWMLICKYLDTYVQDLGAYKVESKDCKALSFKELGLKEASFYIRGEIFFLNF